MGPLKAGGKQRRVGANGKAYLKGGNGARAVSRVEGPLQNKGGLSDSGQTENVSTVPACPGPQLWVRAAVM